MKSPTEIIVLLKDLLQSEENNEREYYLFSRNIQDHKTKILFQEIRHQKNSFCSNLRKEINNLEKIPTPEGTEKQALGFFSHSVYYPLPAQEYFKNGPLQKCYLKEQKNLQLYNYLLAKIFIGQIREILLAYKHTTQLNLNQLEILIQKPKKRPSFNSLYFIK